jgi:ribosomal protein S18 acetylase RimI-like enzyme
MGQTRADTVTLRRATADDVDALVELWLELTDFHVALDSYYTRKPDATGLMRDYFAKQIEVETAVVIVAETDGRVVGYLMAEPSTRPPVFEGNSALMISDTCVKPDHRRLGIGKAMVDELISIARNRSIDRVEVGYSARNEVSIAFWTKIGFRPFSVKASMELT